VRLLNGSGVNREVPAPFYERLGGKFLRPTHHQCFNTLKNQGYAITHHYGHGEQYLCFNFYLLTLLAFYFHQILELTDLTYQQVRTKAGSLRALWEKLRQAINWFIFADWESLLHLICYPNDYAITVQPQPP